VFDPPRPGVDLLMLKLMDGDRCAGTVEDHAAGAGRPLIHCGNVLGHDKTILSFDVLSDRGDSFGWLGPVS